MPKIAVTQYEIEKLSSWQGYEDKIVRLVEQAKNNDANFLLMSEYAGVELGSWTSNQLEVQFESIQSMLNRYQELFISLAKEHQLYIQAGTIPVRLEDGFYRNRAFFFFPDGQIEFQDKLFLTPFEIKTKKFRPGNKLHIFSTQFGKLGINISYDIEFPMLAKRLTECGVFLILVPSCTEKISGLTRVTTSSRARAIENQCYVAHSCLIGKSSWCDFFDINIGQSGIYGPADIGFPEDGILSQAQLNAPMIIDADLNFKKLEHVRERGEMLNFRDMQKDISDLLESIPSVSL